MARTISASVGAGGANKNADVRTIQELLNKVPLAKGGPAPPLAVDGACGPLTVGAIRNFQQKTFGWADGRVDPGGQTLGALNAYDGPGGSPANPGGSPPGLPLPLPGKGGGPAPAPAGLRGKIVQIAQDYASPHPGKVSDLVTMPEQGTGRTIRKGWATLKDFFDVAVAGWQESHWNNKAYMDGVKVPGKRIPQPGRDGVSWCGIFATYVLIEAGLPVKWVLGKGIVPLPVLGDKNFQPGDVLVMQGGTVHHCIAISDDGASMSTVNGNSDYQSILVKPQLKSKVAYYYRATV